MLFCAPSKDLWALKHIAYYKPFSQSQKTILRSILFPIVDKCNLLFNKHFFV